MNNHTSKGRINKVSTYYGPEVEDSTTDEDGNSVPVAFKRTMAQGASSSASAKVDEDAASFIRADR